MTPVLLWIIVDVTLGRLAKGSGVATGAVGALNNVTNNIPNNGPGFFLKFERKFVKSTVEAIFKSVTRNNL